MTKPHFWFRSEIWISYPKKGVETFLPILKLFETSKFKVWSNYFIKIQYLTLKFDGIHNNYTVELIIFSGSNTET